MVIVDMRYLKLLLVAALCILASGESRAQAAPLEFLHGLGDLRYHHLDSRVLGRGLHIYVRLPAAYDEAQAEGLPTIYLLDGGGTLAALAGQYYYLRLGDELPPAILVAISYGAVRFQDGNMRSTDFTAPAAERDFWGGAGNFQSMLERELLPLVESRYRSDPGRRIIFGQSLGGQFVLYTALTRPDLFTGHIASNPALHRNLPFFLQWQGEGPMPASQTRLFVSSGEFDEQRFRTPTLAWVEHWQASKARPWILEARTLEGHTHFSALGESFTEGILWLLGSSENH